jgi:YidC/Oxa1 family membrane protein insertase
MSSPTPPKKDAKELPTELRIVIAFALMLMILVGTPFLARKLGISPAPATQTPPVKSAVESKPEQAQSTNAVAPAPPTEAPAPGAISAATETTWELETPLYKVVLSNQGAVVKSWTLRDFKDSKNKPLEVVNQTGAEKVIDDKTHEITGYPFSWDFRGQKPTVDLKTAKWVAHPAPDGLSVEYDFSDGKTFAQKTFAFDRASYLLRYSDQATLNGSPIPHLVEWRGGFGDMAVYSASGNQWTVRYDPVKGKPSTDLGKSAKNGPVNTDGLFTFAGIEDKYFAAVFLPPANASLQTTTFDDVVGSGVDPSEQPYPGVAVGGQATNQFDVYVGPKDLNALRKVNPNLQNIIAWGYTGFIAKPLFLILQWLTNGFVHNWGWSIMLLTLMINVALLPLRVANLKSMRKMQKLQPEMSKINEKYKGIPMSDPRAANKQQEMMDLYKQHGVNPMGGCIPMLIQMPFLWAFYTVLSVTIEMRNAPWLWISDLSQPEHFAIRFLPLIMIGTSFLMQKMTPMAGGDPSQQKVMQFMPLMWGVFFWSASSGLVLYWLTSNLVQIGQQWFFNKTSSPVVLTAAPAKKAISSKDGRKRT